MSFIDTYIKKYRIGDISKLKRKNLYKIEKQINKITRKAKRGLSFLDSVKKHEDAIGDLIKRVHQHFDGWELNWKTAFSTFHFVINIAIEVYQIIDAMEEEVVPEDLTGEEAWAAKKEFGQHLILFIWEIIGPLDKVLTWIPFKKTIEKKLIQWLAGMGLETARKIFSANKEISNFSTNNSAVFMKAL